MFGLVVFGFIGIVVSGWFWYKEIDPWVQNIVQPRVTDYAIINQLLRFWTFLINVGRLFTDGKFLLIDMLITVSFSSVMGFGEGMAGGILGIWTSNIMSVMIFIYMKKKYKKLKLANK